MNESTYNGWTNYATWRVNLEIFDGMDVGDVSGDDSTPAYDLTPMLKDHAETLIYEAGGGEGNIAVDYALAFLSDVNWHEIAKHMVADETEETETEETEEH
jgi:hypothetical protein